MLHTYMPYFDVMLKHTVFMLELETYLCKEIWTLHVILLCSNLSVMLLVSLFCRLCYCMNVLLIREQ